MYYKQLVLIFIIISDSFQLVLCRRKSQLITARTDNNYFYYNKNNNEGDDVFEKSEISLKIVQRTFKMPPLVSGRSRNNARVTPELGVSCSSSNVTRSLRNLYKKVECTPREAIVSITVSDGSIVFPDTVAVQRCDGMCSGKKKCLPSKKRPIEFYVRTTNPKTKLVFCNVIKVDEDVECRCSCGKKRKCSQQQRFDNKSCKCVCVNMEDYNECILKTAENWRWDSKSCSCKCKSEKICTTGSEWDPNLCKCVRK